MVCLWERCFIRCASLLEKLPIAWSGRESACHGKETYLVERDQRLPLG